MIYEQMLGFKPIGRITDENDHISTIVILV